MSIALRDTSRAARDMAFAPLSVSVICGVITLMGIAYHLGKKSDPLNHGGVRLSGALQNLLFMVSVVLMVFVVASA